LKDSLAHHTAKSLISLSDINFFRHKSQIISASESTKFRYLFTHSTTVNSSFSSDTILEGS
jgi:uncharacterized membrane protein YqhA